MDKRKLFFLIICSLVIIAGLFFSFYKIYGNYAYAIASKDMKERVKESVQEKEMKEIELTAKAVDTQLSEPFEIEKGIKTEGEKYILLLGLDTRGNDFVGRSDSMLLLKIDKSKDKMVLVSIPRDSYVKIIGKGISDKITHAFAYGGKEMSKATVENLFGVEIDNTVVINFHSFENVIDILGGIEVNSPLTFTEQTINSKKKVTIEKGKQVLNGEQTLAYARMRKQDPRGDLGRGERQQEVIESALKSVKSIDDIATVRNLYKEVKTQVDMDVTLKDTISYFPYLKSLSMQENTIEKYQVTGTGTKINGIYYEQVDEENLDRIRKVLHSGEIRKKARDNTEGQENTENLPSNVTEAPLTYKNEKAYKATGSSIRITSKDTDNKKHQSMYDRQKEAEKQAVQKKKDTEETTRTEQPKHTNLMDRISNKTKSELEND